MRDSHRSPSPSPSPSSSSSSVPSASLDALRLQRLSDAQYSVAAAAPPQRVRLAGFSDVFERYCNRLSDAVCTFGADHSVPCECDQTEGTLQCDVPKALPSAPSASVTLTARIADFETPPLLLKSSTHLQHSQCASIASPPPPPPPPGHPFHLRLIDQLHARFEMPLLRQCVAECVGTMFIVVFGVGSVCSAVLSESLSGLWQIAVVWGFGVALAILATASVSDAHLNPAVSLAFAIVRPHKFPLSKLLPYWVAQYVGGIMGGAINLLLFGPAFANFENVNSIVRGSSQSLLTARAFGEYFPDPGNQLLSTLSLSPAFAMMVEAWGTAILMFMILALTDPRHKLICGKEMVPFYIGFTVSVLISLYAPLTQAGWNPARDFGPRVVAALAGWSEVAIPGPRNGFWIYIVGPKIGAPVGAFLYDVLIHPGLNKRS